MKQICFNLKIIFYNIYMNLFKRVLLIYFKIFSMKNSLGEILGKFSLRSLAAPAPRVNKRVWLPREEEKKSGRKIEKN